MTAARVDRYGFPIQTCRRCGGSGRYSYNTIDGDRCYGCQGTGVTHTRKAAPHVAAWRKAFRCQHEPTVQALAVGDMIRDYHAAQGTPFLEVVAIAATDREAGWSTAPDGTRYNVRYFMDVTTADGTTRNMSGCQVVRRAGKVDPAPYVAQSI